MSGGATGRGPGLREVLAVAALVLVAVLAIEALSTLVPAIRDGFRGLPLTIVALVVGTGIVLALVVRAGPTDGRE